MNLTQDYKVIAAGDRILPFWTSCRSACEWVIRFLTEHSNPVSWNEFKNNTDWEEEVANLGYRIPGKPKINRDGLGLYFHKDWSVSFHKVDPSFVDGHRVYYFDWSGIEHIFCDGAGQEALTRNAKAEWGADDDEVDEENNAFT